ncbi:MAG: hypothetical protein Q9218_006837, partial [Villophora microphyllina]
FCGNRFVGYGPIQVIDAEEDANIAAAEHEAMGADVVEMCQPLGHGRAFLEDCYGTDFNSDNLDTPGEQLIFLPPCYWQCPSHQGSVIVGVHGACRNNGRPDAKAALGVFFAPNSNMNYCTIMDRCGPATNQRAELRACIQALVMIRNMKNQVLAGTGTKELKQISVVIIKTISAYLVVCMTEHIVRWKAKGYKTTDNKRVINADYFMRIDQEVEMLKSLGIGVAF